MKIKILILFFATAIFVCCKNTSKSITTTSSNSTSNSGNPFDPTPKKNVFVPDSMDVMVAKTKWPEADLPHLTSGYKIYTANCGRCHGLPEPTQYDEARWGKIVPWMGKKAELNEADQTLILHYVLAKREVILNPK